MSTRHDMNTKGFTLTELIVTIALIGVISIIAFPAIDKLKNDNELEKYKTYEKVMENGAKLYIDSKKSDFWSNYSYGTHKINYNELKVEGLVDAYQDKNIDCSGSYVCAKKTSYGIIQYNTVVICKQKSGARKEVYSTNTELGKKGKTPINC